MTSERFCYLHVTDQYTPPDQHLGSFVVRDGRWLVWHMYRKEIGHGR